jgi:hypothetical protein
MMRTYWHDNDMEVDQMSNIIVVTQHIAVLLLLAVIILGFQKDTMWSIQNKRATIVHYVTHLILFMAIPIMTEGETIASINR